MPFKINKHHAGCRAHRREELEEWASCPTAVATHSKLLSVALIIMDLCDVEMPYEHGTDKRVEIFSFKASMDINNLLCRRLGR